PPYDARLDHLHGRRRLELRAAPAQYLLRVPGDERHRLRQQAIAGLEELKAQLVSTDARIVSELVVNECRELAEQLDPDEAAADDDNRQQLPAPLRAGLHVRALQALDDMVPQHERVGHGLERARVLGPRNQIHVRRRAERDDDVVVRQLVNGPFRRDDARDASFEVDVLDGRLDEARVAEAGPDRLRAVAELQHTGAGLEE